MYFVSFAPSLCIIYTNLFNFDFRNKQTLMSCSKLIFVPQLEQESYRSEELSTELCCIIKRI